MENNRIAVIETKAYRMNEDVAAEVQKYYSEVVDYIETILEPKELDSDITILEKALALYEATSHLKKRVSRAFPREVFEEKLALNRLMRWEDAIKCLFAGEKLSNLNFKEGEYVEMEEVFPIFVNEKGERSPFMGSTLISNKSEWYIVKTEKEEE